jgi:hypothetical protein
MNLPPGPEKRNTIMNYSPPGIRKPTFVERAWAWLMLALMIAIGAITFGATMLIHEARGTPLSGDTWTSLASWTA